MTILLGVTVRDKCVVAAGSVVTKSYGNMKLLAGIPAVVKKNI